MRGRIAIAVAVLLSGPQALGEDKVWRVAELGLVEQPEFRAVALRELARRGFIEGKNLTIETRVGGAELLPELALQLVAAKPDVIVVRSDWALYAAKAATGSIPIVTAPMGRDPVVSGDAATWARPSGNVTGVSLIVPELEPKRMDLLREAFPAAKRIAVLSNHRNVVERGLAPMREAASKAGIELVTFWVGDGGEYQAAFAEMRGAHVDALVIVHTPELGRDAKRLAGLAVEIGVPMVCGFPEAAKSGCLVGYGPSYDEIFFRAADYVARLLGGAKPGELPFQGPTSLKLTVNAKTARALGLTMPSAVLARADEVIE